MSGHFFYVPLHPQKTLLYGTHPFKAVTGAANPAGAKKGTLRRGLDTSET